MLEKLKEIIIYKYIEFSFFFLKKIQSFMDFVKFHIMSKKYPEISLENCPKLRSTVNLHDNEKINNIVKSDYYASQENIRHFDFSSYTTEIESEKKSCRIKIPKIHKKGQQSVINLVNSAPIFVLFYFVEFKLLSTLPRTDLNDRFNFKLEIRNWEEKKLNPSIQFSLDPIESIFGDEKVIDLVVKVF